MPFSPGSAPLRNAFWKEKPDGPHSPARLHWFLLKHFSHGEYHIHFHFRLCGWVRTHKSPGPSSHSNSALCSFPTGQMHLSFATETRPHCLPGATQCQLAACHSDRNHGRRECPHLVPTLVSLLQHRGPSRTFTWPHLGICHCCGRKKGRLLRARSSPGP